MVTVQSLPRETRRFACQRQVRQAQPMGPFLPRGINRTASWGAPIRPDFSPEVYAALRLLGLWLSNWKVQEPFNDFLELFVRSGAKDGVVNPLLVLMKISIMDIVATRGTVERLPIGTPSRHWRPPTNEFDATHRPETSRLDLATIATSPAKTEFNNVTDQITGAYRLSLAGQSLFDQLKGGLVFQGASVLAAISVE